MPAGPIDMGYDLSETAKVVAGFGRNLLLLGVLVPESVNLADIAGSDEGVDIVVLEPCHKGGKLILGKKGLDLDMLRSLISSGHPVEAASPHKLVDDVPADAFVVVGHYAYPLPAVESSGIVIDNQSVEPGTYEADDHHPERVDCK